MESYLKVTVFLAGHIFTQDRMGFHYKEGEIVGDWIRENLCVCLCVLMYTAYLHS